MSNKVLVVLDGIYRFDASSALSSDPDFTYTTLVAALSGAGYAVTKAHRQTDSAATPGFSNFHFDALPAGVSLLDFDAIWLIGFEGRNVTGTSTAGGLGVSQLNAIASYMEAGGGVFATGDHDSVGSDMSGYLPRVRVMRSWYGTGDSASPFAPSPAELVNFSRDDGGRADTVHHKTGGDAPPSQYPAFTGDSNSYVWFENQSDRVPQTITPVPAGPAHPILRNAGHDVTTFPDHMHEGNCLGQVSAAAFNYASTMSPYGDTSKPEFRSVAGHREMPVVIANGISHAQESRYAISGALIGTLDAVRPVNTMSTYDGRKAGVGRIVTGSTFHHYIDINLTGSTDVTSTAGAQGQPVINLVGSDGAKGHGLGDNPAALDDMKAVYANITRWIARPPRALSLVLERSTFSQDEVTASPVFGAAILITVDGLKPSQFPGGGIPALGVISGTPAWAPVITAPAGVPIAFEPTFVDSDDPTMPDRLQRITITYRVHFTGNAFGFAGSSSTLPINATLGATAASEALGDTAWLVLVKAANPFMLDLADANTTSWLSSDVKSFHVVEGQNFHGVTLPNGATRGDALNFIHALAASISSADFTTLPSTEAGSALSVFPTTTATPPKKVYNFALARVRLSPAGADANAVRVFFRLFTTQTTAALTYHLDGSGMPVEGYRRTAGGAPIALPGTQGGGSQWLSFPMFAAARAGTPAAQTDPNNVQNVSAAATYRMYGALIDNNLTDPYLPSTPLSSGPALPLTTLTMGEHQCVVAQIEYAGAPIPDGAMPWTSDKLSQRNLAVVPVANPGLEASRTAMHTFEIEATPAPASAALRPDELMLHWSAPTPTDAVVRIHIPSWQAQAVVDLADRYYARHEITAIDEHTIELPADGTRYVPIPASTARQNGVIAAEFPLGIHKGQRFDLALRQITNKSRNIKMPPSKTRAITLQEAEKLLEQLQHGNVAEQPKGGRGVYTLGENKVLITDLSVMDDAGDHALVVEHPAPALVEAAIRQAAPWRQTIGAFQLGVPVETREDMLLYQMRLLSVMRWRLGQLPRKSFWRDSMQYYVNLLAEKVQALGGDPWAVPATPDGNIPQLTDSCHPHHHHPHHHEDDECKPAGECKPDDDSCHATKVIKPNISINFNF